LQQLECGPAGIVESDELAIDCRVRRQRLKRLDDSRIFSIQQIAVARIQCDDGGVSRHDQSIAVELEFPGPALAIRELRHPRHSIGRMKPARSTIAHCSGFGAMSRSPLLRLAHPTGGGTHGDEYMEGQHFFRAGVSPDPAVRGGEVLSYRFPRNTEKLRNQGEYQARVQQLVDSKEEGKAPPRHERAKHLAPVVDLMAALKKSIAAQPGKKNRKLKKSA
jgi:hypothetical protein